MTRAAVIDICREFGIRIVPKHRYPAPGETRAVATLDRIWRKHGEGHLRFVLSTIAETKGAGGLLTETTLWAVSDLVRACPQWADERTSEWLDAWDKMPFGEMILSIEELRGRVSQRAALAGVAYHWLQEALRPEDVAADRHRITLWNLADEHAIEVGRKLLQAKASLPHGHFWPWVKERKEISQRAAEKCMRLALEELRERDPAGYEQHRSRWSLAEKVDLGRTFIAKKRELPRGEFYRWVQARGYSVKFAGLCRRLARKAAAGEDVDEAA